MNTSSKYANLPFIASGEKDVYETEGPIEPDQITSTTDQPIHDASIEIIPSSTVDAYNKFSQADSVNSTKNEKKSLSQCVELFEKLTGDLEEWKKIKNQEPFNNLEEFFSNLDNFQNIFFKNIATPQLINDVQKNISDSNNHLVYELYRKPDKDEVFEMARINALEQRMKKIETTLGLNETIKDSNYPLLNNFLKDQSIMDIVINLNNKLVQLDSSSLDRIEARLNLINEKLNQISDKKSSLTELDKEDKLNEIHNFYVKVDQNRSLIPNILERVQVLSELQKKASTFLNTLNYMENLQKEIKDSIENNTQNLKNLRELFSKTENIQQIVDDFQQRLDKLQK